jgi:hypothetical protein
MRAQIIPEPPELDCLTAKINEAISAAEAGCGPDNLELSMTTDESRHCRRSAH